MGPTHPILLLLLLLALPLSFLIQGAVINPQQALEPEYGDSTPPTLQKVLDALEVMQDHYFDPFAGTWPNAIDWTAAVMGTHVSATLSTFVSSLDTLSVSTCSDLLRWQNTIDRYFSQLTLFYFGENAISLRNQAYDDMLWVVLGWLENVKFVEQYSAKYKHMTKSMTKSRHGWHGLQFSPMAAHRARIFYELAASGWDTELCEGGMTWNPRLRPYKNAITNELFISASVSMYLYFPGDNNTSPWLILQEDTYPAFGKPHDPAYLGNAVKAYKWLKESGMQNPEIGLFQDGFHVTGWYRFPNGTVDPGTGNCDEVNAMVYTYNQGVLLTANRGLWIATAQRSYLDDGHALVDSVIRATGWLNHDRIWRGLGRNGVLEEFCDRGGYCSQDSQTFKGIFFHHLAEFCRPLRKDEERFIDTYHPNDFDKKVYEYHQARCAAYGAWVTHNANAAAVTIDLEGRFGMWWGKLYREPPNQTHTDTNPTLPENAIDHINQGMPADWHARVNALAAMRPATVGETPGSSHDVNDRGRGRTVETQSGGLSVLRAQWLWESELEVPYT